MLEAIVSRGGGGKMMVGWCDWEYTVMLNDKDHIILLVLVWREFDGRNCMTSAFNRAGESRHLKMGVQRPMCEEMSGPRMWEAIVATACSFGNNMEKKSKGDNECLISTSINPEPYSLLTHWRKENTKHVYVQYTWIFPMKGNNMQGALKRSWKVVGVNLDSGCDVQGIFKIYHHLEVTAITTWIMKCWRD